MTPRTRNTPRLLAGVLCGLAALSLFARPAEAAPDSITQSSFGHAPGGQAVSLYTLTNRRGMTVKITNFGATLTSVIVPDRTGHLDDVLLGFDSADGYVKTHGAFLGALIGRYANRIAGAKVTLDGKTHQLYPNNPYFTIHGGKVGFDQKVWAAAPRRLKDGVGLSLTLFSPDGDEGYPGNLTVHVLYTLTDSNALKIDYRAVTDKPTVINLTSHPYFNLNGAGSGPVLNQQLMINANRFTPTDKVGLPLGPLRPVAGTPFDFRRSHAIGKYINVPNQQLKNGGGYDHNFVLNHPAHSLGLAARAYSPQTGIVLTVYTTQPGMQLYTANGLDGRFVGKGGKHYVKRSAFCLECEHFPASPSHPAYPTTVLRPGQVFRQTTIEQFSVR